MNVEFLSFKSLHGPCVANSMYSVFEILIVYMYYIYGGVSMTCIIGSSWLKIYNFK